MMKIKKIAVIGSGFSGLSAASYLAKGGFEVIVLEKNDTIGGRARMFQADGFSFDMGPSWYWMPDVFERFFANFNHQVSDFYELVRLDPSYRVYWPDDEFTDLPTSLKDLFQLFEDFDPGSSPRLQKFLDEAAYKYKVGIHELVYKPGRSLTEYLDARLLVGLLKMDVLTNMAKHVRKVTQHPKLLEILEFPTLFLGALPKNTPALYSLMNYADLVLGTWYPKGGMHEIVKAMHKVALEQGVKFETDAEITDFKFNQNKIHQISSNNKTWEVDLVVSSADYHHTEQLLPEHLRSYSPKYWDSRVMAPSSLLFYLGIDSEVKGLLHHNLFFDKPFEKHAHQIYTEPAWPDEPLFYVSAPSKTDHTVAPKGKENVFILIPLASDLEDTEELREKYYHMIMDRLENKIGEKLRDKVIFKRSFAMNDFKSAYHAFKGNAYGLANTLMQTAILKPSCKSKKIENLYFVGQLTVPGPGVPPSIISGEVVANEILKDFK